MAISQEDERGAVVQEHDQERHRLFQMLLERSYQRRKVTLSSGRESDFYIDCKQVSLFAEGVRLIGTIFNRILTSGPPLAAVGGLTMGADPLAVATSLASLTHGPLTLQPFVVRKEPKVHGAEAYIEGVVRPGQHVAILEDVITTGASTIKAITRARSFGLVVVEVLALVDRQEDGGREAICREFAGSNVRIQSLFTRMDFERGRLLFTS